MRELLSAPEIAAPTPLFFRNMDTFMPAEMSAEVIVEQPSGPDVEQIAAEAREAGLREGIAHAVQQMESRVEQERQGIAKAVEGFLNEKQRYFIGLEREVVRLSLAIAERVLHREASMDPTLLAGAAKVALEQLNDGTEATLRVATGEADAWSRSMAEEANNLKVMADATLQPGECLLETATGTVELGVRAQLQEIERGFFELIGRKPAVSL